MEEPKLDPDIIHNISDILVAAMHIDRYLIAALERFDDDFSEIDTLVMQIVKQLLRNKHMLHDAILSDEKIPNEDVSSHLEKVISYNELMENKNNSPRARLQRLCTCCDRCFTFYDDVMNTTSDQAIKLMAQTMASLALDRIGIMRNALDKEYASDSSAI